MFARTGIPCALFSLGATLTRYEIKRSVGTAVTMLAALGGPAGDDYVLGSQLWVQIKSVLVAILWSGIGSAVAFYIAKLVTGGRVSAEVEREGLDLGEHGERAYNY